MCFLNAGIEEMTGNPAGCRLSHLYIPPFQMGQGAACYPLVRAKLPYIPVWKGGGLFPVRTHGVWGRFKACRGCRSGSG